MATPLSAGVETAATDAEPAREPGQLAREIAGVLLLGLGAFALLALATYDPGDDPARRFPQAVATGNSGGATGAAIAGLLVDWVGTLGAIAGAASVLLLGAALLGRGGSRDIGRRALGAL